MTFNPQFLDMMKAAATVKSFASNDGYGNPSFGAPVAIVCHPTYQEKTVRSDKGDDDTSYAQIECPPPGYVVNGVATPTIAPESRVTLPDGIERRCIGITVYFDEHGSATHQYVMLN